MPPDADIEYIATIENLTFIAIVDALRTAQNISDGITSKRLRLDSVVRRLDILHDHRLLGSRRRFD